MVRLEWIESGAVADTKRISLANVRRKKASQSAKSINQYRNRAGRVGTLGRRSRICITRVNWRIAGLGPSAWDKEARFSERRVKDGKLWAEPRRMDGEPRSWKSHEAFPVLSRTPFVYYGELAFVWKIRVWKGSEWLLEALSTEKYR